ncbi:replication initiation protein [Persicobacter psychrovividus]|uniref:Initiator Rep protein WH1 domain-containing protein n=1 Tax=Persicobacter psychrovividus TaxID=387638 RepID=A0ABM7VMN0_9BACT|nr:hypothetical protein PEPS_45500 [Persicobacter psychrovividus]
MDITATDKLNFRIIKHNKLINAKEGLTITQHRIVMLLAINLTKEDRNFTEHRINIREVLGIGPGDRIGSGYDRVRKAAVGLTNSSIYIEEGDDWIAFPLITVARGNKREDFIRVKFASEMRPFLLQLKEGNYTQYMLKNVYKFQSAYSVRVYELMKQYFPNIKTRPFTYVRLRELLNMGSKYANHYPSFKRRVLGVAIREINEHSDLWIEFEEIRKSRKIDTLVFTISANPHNKQAMPNIEVPAEKDTFLSQETVINQEVVEVEAEVVGEQTRWPDWVKTSMVEKMIKMYGPALVTYAVKKVDQTPAVNNPMGYLYQGLKEKWWEEEYLQPTTDAVETKQVYVRPKPQKVDDQEALINQLKMEFGAHNKMKRQQVMAQYDGEESRSEYVLELEFNDKLAAHKQRYLRSWESIEGPSEDALTMYAGWLLKKYGEQTDWDPQTYIQQRLQEG